ncbi:ATP-binding protein [Sphingomonas jatrophae]|uniref:histidine kinase n=1 Tax=Sphingomonas jatrophae TaxID=1166337 RepID=A0A1I6LR27_9SPHN|nr:ATP-binding protein [Sphingomonas jatrophae]SFS05868.1 Signal transduction histidine kinase [Sphingomonas jatrophae]
MTENGPLGRLLHGHLGLLGRILAILLLTVVIEFGVSTVLYERASGTLVREDEARRLAEHLVIARKLVAERPWRERPDMADELTTGRYLVHWQPTRPPAPRIAPELEEMRRQILAWEPELARSNLTLRLASPGRDSTVMGELALPDASWLHFATRQKVLRWDLALGRIAQALVPAFALLLVGGLLIRRTLSPLRRLAHATETVGLGQQVSMPEAGTEEVRHLIRAFNTMQRRIHRLIEDRTQALAAVGHDLRTPISRLRLRLESLGDEAAERTLGPDIDEMEEMVSSLLAFLAGEDDPEPAVLTDLAVLAATCADDYADAGREVDYVGPDNLDHRLRRSAIKRALTNLVDNALRHGSRATIRLDVGADEVRLAVEDDGPGIPAERLTEVVRPFVRLNEARARDTKGLGLGLAIVQRAARRESGALRLSNRPNGGLRAEIILPRT